MIGIYKITSPTKRIYIGQSRNIKKRISNYKSLDCKKQKRLYASFIKHGVEKHIFEIIEECELINLNIRERHYQDLFNVLSVNGLNCTLTEHSDKVRVYSDATRLKMSKSRIGIKLSDNTKNKLSEISKGNSHAKGYKHTAKALIKISECSRGRKSTDKQKEAARASNSKKVINSETGVVYNSIEECALAIGIKANNLGRYLNSKRKNKTKIKFYENTL